MTQVLGPRLPCLFFVQTLLTTDEDTNYLMDLIPQPNSRASITIDITRALHERMKNRDPLFKSLKQLEWALELLGYGFVPPQQQYLISSGNYLESILAVYEYVLCDKVVLELEGRNVEFKSVETIFDIKDPYYQTLLMKMLGHMTLLFDEKNFERKQGSMNSSQEFKAHEEEFKVPGRLCGIALKIIHKFIYRIYPFLSTSNWQNLIRLLTALTTFLLDTSTRVKTPERVNIAAVELMFNAWILSGLQDEELWALFKKVIYRVLHRSIVISYWVEICTELTIKLLVDEKCFNPPKLYVVGDKKQIEYQRKMLIIHHSIKDSTNEMEIVRSKSLFPQPFIFRISYEQTKYLWAKMVNLMHDANFTKDTKIHFMVAKGINNVVTLLLKLGRHHKFNDSINDPTKWLSMQTTRRVLIKHEFEYFRHLIKYLLQNDKVRAGADDILDDSMEANLSPVMKTPTMNSSTSVPTTISSFDTDSPLGKSASPKFKLQYSYIQDEPQWYIRDHKAPDGETILKTFGKLLFESADPQITASQEARLVSLTTLSQIFMKAKGPFSDQSLRKFYKLLLLYMNSEVQRNYFQVLLKYSCQIFTSTNLRYYTYLQIAFIEKLINYHNNAKPESLLQKHEILLRNSASKFCSSAISPLLQDIQLINKEYMHGRNILNVLNELLTTSLLRDRDAFESPKIVDTQVKKVLRSLSRSSWNLAIYSILTNKIGSFISKINDNWLEKPPYSSNKLVLDLFLSIGEFYLTRISLDEDPIILNDVALAGNLILERVIGFLQNKKVALAEAPKSLSPQHSTPGQPVEKPWESVQVISSAFLCLYTWTLILMQIKEKIDQDNRREFIAMFFSTFNSLLAFSKIEPFTVYINTILSIISSAPGSIPFAKNLPFIGSILLNYSPQTISLDKFNEELEQKNVIHIGINDDTILSFYDLNINYIDEGFLLIIRNACGKTIWNSEVFYKLASSSDSQISNNKPRKSQLEKNKSHENPQDVVKNSDESFYEERHSLRKKSAEYEDLQQLLEEQFKSEEEYEIAYQQQTQQKPQENKTLDEEEEEEDDENDKVTNRLKKLKVIKQFLSNTGLITSKNIYELGVIPQDQETMNFFKQIDSVSMRLQILADILYVNDTKSTVIEALPNGDQDFNKFVDALGNVVSTEVLECGAYETIRNHVEKYEKIIYSTNSIYEILFNILNLSHKKNFLSENYETNSIVIIWNSRTQDIHNQTYPLLINKLQIKEYKTAVVITPLNNGQFCIDLLKHDQNFLAFPPVKGMVCNNDYLATFILQLIINIDREYQHAVNAHSCLENTFKGFKNRKKVISEFIHKHTSHPESVGQVLRSIFANDQTQEIPPQSNI